MSKSTVVVRQIRALCAAGLLCVGLVATAGAAKPPQYTEDGLELSKAKGVGLLYRRPGASLAGYTKVIVDPVQVAFSKNWNPRDYGTYGLKATDVERIRTELGALAHDTFVKVLQDGGYPSVTEADEGVLHVTAYIVDLYINAPDTMQAGRSRTYVANAGQMMLVMELRDAVTGTLLARAADRKAASDSGYLSLSSSVFNRAEAENMLQGWGKRLKQGLDAARKP